MDKTPLTSRPAALDDCENIALLLTEMYKEVGRAILHPQKAWAEIVDTVTNGAAYVVEHKNIIVASVGLIQLPGGLFYSDAPWFIDKWLYVRPQYRPHNLDAMAFSLLLEEVKTLVNSTGMPCILTVFNDKRVRARNDVTRIAERLCVYPAGAMVEIHPEEPPE